MSAWLRLAGALGATLLWAQATPEASAQSPGCTALVQSASQALNAQLAYDSNAVKQPTSVRDLTCLDGFFNGVGLNLFSSMTDFASLLDSLGGRLCSALKSAWNSEVGSLRCGLTVTGFDLGFGGLGGGNLCPTLSIGGGGASLGSVGLSSAGNTGGGYYLNTQIQAPTGFQQ
ncbi:MAG: hypothetical protein JO122_09950 [Acetobacteraceae bacterium]|nr:hypothetical protein [Acetobacteraceae bacterium]